MSIYNVRPFIKCILVFIFLRDFVMYNQGLYQQINGTKFFQVGIVKFICTSPLFLCLKNFQKKLFSNPYSQHNLRLRVSSIVTFRVSFYGGGVLVGASGGRYRNYILALFSNTNLITCHPAVVKTPYFLFSCPASKH